MKHANYTLTPRPVGKPVWAHRTKPVWVVEYARAGAVYFQAYIATGVWEDGKQPWDMPSSRLGDPIQGFSTLKAAMHAGDQA